MGEWAADMGAALRAKAKMKESTKDRDQTSQVRALEEKLSRGSAMTRPYAVCTVTVPKTLRVAEYGRRLDGAIRAAGFTGLRLDLAQDVAFAASVVPMGVSLTRRGRAGDPRGPGRRLRMDMTTSTAAATGRA